MNQALSSDPVVHYSLNEVKGVDELPPGSQEKEQGNERRNDRQTHRYGLRGHLLGDQVFTALHRVTPEIHYYKNKTILSLSELKLL